MSFQEDCVHSWIEQLPAEGQRAFAREQWAFLKGQGSRPDYQEHGISYKESETIVINLASRK